MGPSEGAGRSAGAQLGSKAMNETQEDRRAIGPTGTSERSVTPRLDRYRSSVTVRGEVFALQVHTALHPGIA